MLTGYANEISVEEFLYQPAERTSDIQLPSVINILLLAIWFVICLVGFTVIFIFRYPVAGTVIIAVPTFLGMVIKPSFALCVFAIVLPTSAGVGIGEVFTVGRGVGIALAIAFALNLMLTRPRLNMRNKALWVVVLWSLWIFFASLLSPYPKAELRLAFTHFQLMLLVLITYWILETNSERAFIWMLRSYVIGSLGTIIITFITGAAMRSMTEAMKQERYGATLGRAIDRNMLAVLIAMGFLAAIYLFIRDKNIFLRIIYVITIGFLPLMILRTGSRGALIALSFTLLSPLLFIRQIWRRPALAILLIIIIMLTAGASAYLVQTQGLPGRVLQRLTSPEEVREAFAYRMSLNKAAVRMGLTRLFGSSGFFAWYELSEVRHTPHSDFFRALGYYGVPAAAIFTVLMVMMIVTIWRIPLGAEKLYARAVLTFLIVMGLGLGQLEYKCLWLFLAITMAAERIGWLYRGQKDVSSVG